MELVGDSWIMEHTSEFMIPEPLQVEVVRSQVKDRISFIFKSRNRKDGLEVLDVANK